MDIHFITALCKAIGLISLACVGCANLGMHFINDTVHVSDTPPYPKKYSIASCIRGTNTAGNR